MKLLEFPHDRDPYLVRIDKIADILAEDESGEYLDEILLVLINHVRSLEESDESRVLDQKLVESRTWAWEVYSSEE